MNSVPQSMQNWDEMKIAGRPSHRGAEASLIKSEHSRKSTKQEVPELCKIAGKEASRYGKDFDRHSMLGQHARKTSELRWSDLEVGKLLGTGAFCHVYEVTVREMARPSTKEKVGLQASDSSIDVWDLFNKSGINQEVAQNTSNERANDNEGTTSFALKHLDPQYLNGKHEFADCAIDLVMEAKILACLRHPNIIKLHAVTGGSISKVFTREGGYFLLLDRLHGSLNERIRDWADTEVSLSSHERAKRLEHRLKAVALGLSGGMKYLHENMVIYRDLKPSNVGFALSGEVKLYDFGLAREILDDGRKMTGYTGSARYMAPEVARSDLYGLSADVYSYGILLWELCSLQKAYPSMSKQQHMDLVVGSQVRPKLSAIEGVSSSVKKLVQSCWSHVPTKRPTFDQIQNRLCFEWDLLEAPNGSSKNSKNNRVMRLRKQQGSRSLFSVQF